MTDEEYEIFKKEFWVWFDSISETDKERFWYFKEDMAEIFFYNKIFSQKSEKSS